MYYVWLYSFVDGESSPLEKWGNALPETSKRVLRSQNINIPSYITAEKPGRHTANTTYSLLSRNIRPSQRVRISFTPCGFSHNAQCDVFTCSTVNCGMKASIPLLRCGGSAESLRAWMKRTGTSMVGRSMRASSSL